MRESTDEIRVRIMEATIDIFNEKGLKFTMDDIAKELSMSKKTIYTVFKDKESLFVRCIDYCFDNIKRSEQEIYEDSALSLTEKLSKIMIVLPGRYKNIDFRKLSGLSESYPKLSKRVEKRIESGWEITITILEEGIKSGEFRETSIPIVKAMFEASIQKFIGSDVLVENGISYEEGLNRMMDIILRGIVKEV